MHTAQIPAQVRAALAEDLGSGDATALLIPAETRARARVIARQPAVVCGTEWASEVFAQLDPAVRIDWLVRDGEHVAREQPLCELHGPARAVLSGERTCLNFLQTLSGTATTTARYVDAVAHTRARLLDTRKTIPGLRLAQKYAVRCGGGENHRIGLFDAMLIKENHIIAAGGLPAAVQRARALAPQLRLIVEVEDLDEMEQAIAAGVDRVLLDNFSLGLLRHAVARNAGRVLLEASGGVNHETIRGIAETGVDYISVGNLTKDVRAVDLSLRFLDLPGG